MAVLMAHEKGSRLGKKELALRSMQEPWADTSYRGRGATPRASTQSNMLLSLALSVSPLCPSFSPVKLLTAVSCLSTTQLRLAARKATG